MKRLRYILALLLTIPSLALAQSTTVSVTVTDQGSQVWSNGTISYIFQPNGFPTSQYVWNGSSIPSQYLSPTVVNLNGSGTASFSIPNSGQVFPSGSSWLYTICPNASIACTQVSIPTAGSTQNISSTVTASLAAITLAPTAIQRAYSDSEVKPPNTGYLYYNVTTPAYRYWNGSAWVTLSGGGGGGTIQNTIMSLKGDGAGNAVQLPDPTNGNLIDVDVFPANPGVNDVVVGIGAAPNIFKGGTTPFLGGQGSVIIGHAAGASVTTAREDVMIGDSACTSLTGSGDGATSEDSIVECIGSEAGEALLTSGFNSPMDDTFIGQKSAVNTTSAGETVETGNHTGNGLATTNDSSFYGYNAGTNLDGGATSSTEDSFFGASSGQAYGSTTATAHNTAMGFKALSTMGNGAAYNTAIGYEAGTDTAFSHIITGTNNIFMGVNAGSNNSDFSGAFNVVIGDQAARNMTNGSYNIVVGNQAGHAITSGGANTVISNLADTSSGNGEVCLGYFSCQFTDGTLDWMVAVGPADTKGEGSIAIGGDNIARTNAGNTAEVVIGNRASADGANDVVLGAFSTATGTDSIAIGPNATVSSDGANEIGPGNCPNDHSLCVQGTQIYKSGFLTPPGVDHNVYTCTDSSGNLVDCSTQALPGLLYNTSGTAQTAAHIVNGSGTMTSGSLVVTFSGASVFTSSSSYVCSPDDSTGINGIDVVYTSGTSVTFNGTGSDAIRFSCIGN